jgi:hypothetical protein
VWFGRRCMSCNLCACWPCAPCIFSESHRCYAGCRVTYSVKERDERVCRNQMARDMAPAPYTADQLKAEHEAWRSEPRARVRRARVPTNARRGARYRTSRATAMPALTTANSSPRLHLMTCAAPRVSARARRAGAQPYLRAAPVGSQIWLIHGCNSCAVRRQGGRRGAPRSWTARPPRAAR